jgi:hypothetical protein
MFNWVAPPGNRSTNVASQARRAHLQLQLICQSSAPSGFAEVQVVSETGRAGLHGWVMKQGKALTMHGATWW